MKGSFEIQIQNNKVKYEFTIRRNITVIQGDSATGKTTLVDMIREYQQNGQESGVTLSCKKKCVVLEGQNWKQELSLISDSIVFIDEGNRFVSSVDFASTIKETDNYYVIVTREGMETLPYSVDEIYGIHTSGKYADLKQIYHEFYHIYNFNNSKNLKTDTVISEDSNSGYEFFSKLCNDKQVKCIPANGKSNIFKMIDDSDSSEKFLIIADGAAFGSQMNKLMLLINRKKNAVLFLPESFEYLLLKADIFDDSEVRKILENPQDFIESKDFFSWEQFFTNLLVEKSQNSYLKYSKKKLNKNYLEEKVFRKISSDKNFSVILRYIDK